MKKLLLLCVLLAGSLAQAQFTTVTGTMIEYAGGKYNVDFAPAASTSYTFNGSPFLSRTNYAAGSLDGTGAFTLTLPDNTNGISPAGSKWNFTFCTAGGSPCFTAAVTIAGASQDISATILPLRMVNLTPGKTVATFNFLAQGANLSTTTLYTVPLTGAGLYRFSCYTIVTQAATTSSTLPQCQVNWTDSDNSSAGLGIVLTAASTANTLFAHGMTAGGSGVGVVDAKAGTNITFATNGYASVGGTSMQYAVHARLEYLGN